MLMIYFSVTVYVCFGLSKRDLSGQFGKAGRRFLRPWGCNQPQALLGPHVPLWSVRPRLSVLIALTQQRQTSDY